MDNEWMCWKCGADISRLPRPLGGRAECLACHAELHVCLMCRHFDRAKAKQCREPMAEDVKDKSKANFCEWFQAKPLAFTAANPIKKDARSQLDALFGEGGDTQEKPDPKSALDKLFGD